MTHKLVLCCHDLTLWLCRCNILVLEMPGIGIYVYGAGCYGSRGVHFNRGAPSSEVNGTHQEIATTQFYLDLPSINIWFWLIPSSCYY